MIRVHGVGPLFWGVEKETASTDKRFIARSFMVETLPPWRISMRALRFRVGGKELHLGTCAKSSDPERVMGTEHSDPAVVGALQALYTKDADYEEQLWDS